MGRNSAGHSRSAIAHFEFDAGAAWSDRALIKQAQSLFDGSVNWRETSWPDSPNQAQPTFLLQLVTLLNKRTRTATGRYVYSEQEYVLMLERRQPSGDGQRLVTVRGKIRNLRTGRETSFRVWLDDDSSIVPVRFEFQPRSFLRLTFEAVKI
jgi:predicted acyl esterase